MNFFDWTGGADFINVPISDIKFLSVRPVNPVKKHRQSDKSFMNSSLVPCRLFRPRPEAFNFGPRLPVESNIPTQCRSTG